MLKFIPSIVFAGLLASLVVATGQANAAIAPLSPAELKEQAEEIFTGKVLSIQEKDGMLTKKIKILESVIRNNKQKSSDK